jgi:hypothetical protein
MPRGRKLLTGERALTAVGRQQKRRNFLKENLPPMGSEDRFRRELFWWLHERAPFYPALDVSVVVLALGQLQTAIVFDVFKFGRKEPYNWQKAYLARFGWFDKKSGTLQPQGFSFAMLPHIYQSGV